MMDGGYCGELGVGTEREPWAQLLFSFFWLCGFIDVLFNVYSFVSFGWVF